MENITLPIDLPDKAIKEFQDLMKKHYRISLNFEEAKRRARQVMN